MNTAPQTFPRWAGELIPPGAIPYPSSPLPRIDEALDFLTRYVAGDFPGYVQIVAIEPLPPEEKSAQIVAKSTTPQQLESLRSFIEQHVRSWNLYFAVNPLKQPLGKKACKADVQAAAYDHVDIDPRKGFDFATERERIRQEIETFSPRPTVIIDSGGGFACFWRREQLAENDGNYGLLEAVNKRLAEHFGGGDSCQNIDRIMRLPGTLNFPTRTKLAKGRRPEPTLAQLVEFDAARAYKATDFNFLPAAGKRQDKTNTAPAGDLPARFSELLKTDHKLRRRWEGSTEGLNDTSRSGMDYSLKKLLQHRGFSAKEQAAILRAYPHGKAREKGDKYIEDMLDPDEAGLGPKERISRLRSAKKETSEKRRLISGIVLDALREAGAFYRTPLDLYYFDRGEATLLPIEALEFRARINARFGINGSEPDWQFVLEDVRTEALLRSTPTEVRRFAHYANGQHYLYAGENRVFLTDGGGTREVPNGTDGVLFLNPTLEAVHLPTSKQTGRALLRVLRVPRFKGARNLRPAQERKLFAIWAIALLFMPLLPTKPLLLMFGPKGSGKTSALKALLRALFGREASVFSLSKEKEDAFLAALTNSYLLALDNVDGWVRWLPDHLAVAATGGAVPLRTLYKTNELAQYPIRCFVAMTSREPDSFTRDDIADRLLVLSVDRFERFVPEAAMMQEIDRLRPQMWVELLEIVRRVVATLAEHKPGRSAHRLADFADLALAIGPALGIRRERVQEMLEAMDAEKTEFALEHDYLCQALVKWLATHGPMKPNEWIDTGTLYKEMEAAWGGEKFPVANPISLGRKLPKRRADFASLLQIEGPKEGKGNTKCWRLTPGPKLKI